MRDRQLKTWYVATLIVQCRVGDAQPPYTCDEQIRLIHATHADSAYEKALESDKAEEETYLNQYGVEVH